MSLCSFSNVTTTSPSCNLADWEVAEPECSLISIDCEPVPIGNSQNGIIFTCAIDDITYVIPFETSTGADQNGYNTYDNAPITVNGAPDNDGFMYNLVFNTTTNRWESFNVITNQLVFFSSVNTTAPSCNIGDWEVGDPSCSIVNIECEIPPVTDDFILVRTFTATDECGNIGTCDVTYTWSIGEPCDDEAPILDCPVAEDFGLVTETPTSFVESVLYTDNYDDGVTTDFIDSDITVVSGNDLQIGSEFRFIFEAGYILTFGDAPSGTLNDAPYYTGYVTDYSGNVLPQYGNFELIYYFNNAYQDYSIVRNDEELGYGSMVDGAPSCVSDDWYVESVDGHNKAFVLECGQSESTFEYEFTRTFYANDACGNVGECSVTYTWTIPGKIARERETLNDENFKFSLTNRGIGSNNNQVEKEINFKAFPVPFDNEITLTYEFDYRTDVTIEIFDTKGLLVLTESNTRYVAGSTGRTKLDLSRTSSQVFYVKLTTNQGSVTKKIVSSGK